MPEVRALSLKRGVHELRRADQARSDRALRGLETRSEDRVRRRSDAHAGGIRLAKQRERALAVHSDGLLGPHVLARGDGARGDLDVRRGNGEVHDQVNVGVRQHSIRIAPRRNAMLFRLRASTLRDEVADGDDAHVREGREVLEVSLADDTGADDADAQGRAHATNPPSRRNVKPAAMSSKTSPGAWSYSMTANWMLSFARRASARGTSPVPGCR